MVQSTSSGRPLKVEVTQPSSSSEAIVVWQSGLPQRTESGLQKEEPPQEKKDVHKASVDLKWFKLEVETSDKLTFRIVAAFGIIGLVLALGGIIWAVAAAV